MTPPTLKLRRINNKDKGKATSQKNVNDLQLI